MRTEVKILTFDKLNRVVENMQSTFASKSLEDDVIKTEVSKTQPIDQTIGDIWFIEQERN